MLGIMPVTMCLLSAAGADPIYLYDISRLNELDLHEPANAREAWDTAHLAASLQGIVNREAPRLFLRFMPETDAFWLDYCQEVWLKDREVVEIESLRELLDTFRDDIEGVVVYDDRVAATSNLASTIAGVESRICLRHDVSQDSVYQRVMAMELGLGDVFRLMKDDGAPLFTGEGTIPGTSEPSTGSAKNDAYLWACYRYLDTGLCSPEVMAYYIDAYWLKKPHISGFSNATLTNHDYFISKGGFFFDLHVWEEESPIDDPEQAPGTDVATLRRLLEAQVRNNGGAIYNIGGFTPWAWKYTTHGQSEHGGVDTEWKYAKVISSYNGVMDADALGLSGLANASFYQHFPMNERYPQNDKPTEADLKEAGYLNEDGTVAPLSYVLIYMGDYDSAAWLTRHVPKWWNDPAHGEILTTWAFNPNLKGRAPQVMHYVRTHQTEKDWFMSGDNGAGYLNPSMLFSPHRDSGLPDALDAWVRYNKPYFEQFDLSITGFVIDGHAPAMGDRGMNAYLRFSPGGIVGQKMPPQGVFQGEMPFIRMATDLTRGPEEEGERLAAMAGINRPKFLPVRTILWSPSRHKTLMETAMRHDDGIRFVDPFTFFALLKRHELNKAAGTVAVPPRNHAAFVAMRTRDGMTPLMVNDGPYRFEERSGRTALVQDAPAGTQYVYFETADALNRQLADGGKATVTVEILGTAAADLVIEYNGAEAAYQEGPAASLTGSGEWVELTYELPDAAFQHAQNRGADFRIVNPGVELVIHRVEAQLAE